MRVVAILAAYNEARFIGACLEHLTANSVEVYLIDNESTDDTVAIAREFKGRGLAGIENMPREGGHYRWRNLLARKEQVAATLDADWFIHLDADEFRLPPQRSGMSLGAAIAEADRQGFNAVNFTEFTFVPTIESPFHDRPDFQQSMRWYYPFAVSSAPERLNAWKRQAKPVELAWSGGHVVRFDGLRMYPDPFPMRHYLYLSVDQAVRKYVERQYAPEELSVGWHVARAGLRREDIKLVPASLLKVYTSDDELDASGPRSSHYLFDRSGSQPSPPRTF